MKEKACVTHEGLFRGGRGHYIFGGGAWLFPYRWDQAMMTCLFFREVTRQSENERCVLRCLPWGQNGKMALLAVSV